jgi:Thymidylate synthase
MSQLKPLSISWEDVYHANLMQAFLAPGMELVHHTFDLGIQWGIDDRSIMNPQRGFRREFSQVMADWILDGKVQVSEAMLALNPNAAKFATVLDDEKHGYHVTAYGPRIKSQIQFVVDELQRSPDSRRACIMMLAPSDQFVAEAMAVEATKCEYLCTYGFNFRLRSGRLDMHVAMRSNNYTTTVCQDVYVFAELQKHIAGLLGVPEGHYFHFTTSGHIVKGEEAKAAAILNAYRQTAPFVGQWPKEWHEAWDAFEAVEWDRFE